MAFGDLKGTLSAVASAITNPFDATGSVAVSVGDLVVAVLAERTDLTITACADNLGNNYTAQNAGSDSGNSAGRCFYSIVTVAGTITFVRATTTASNNDVAFAATVHEGPFGAIDANPANNNNTKNTTPFTCPATGTLTSATELVICWMTMANGKTDMAATSPLLLGINVASGTGANTNGVAIGYKVVASTSSTAPEFTAGANSTNAVQGTLSFTQGTSNSTAVLPGVANVAADTKLFRAALSVLNGTSDLIASANLFKPATATLAGVADLIANAVVGAPSNNVVFGASAQLLANTLVYMVGSATLPGTAALIAGSTIYRAGLATLPGSGQLIVSTTQRSLISAVLAGSADILTDPRIVSRFVASVWSSSADIVASLVSLTSINTSGSGQADVLADLLLVAGIPAVGGSSRFYGPFADLIDYPAPKRPIKKRKQITKAQLPPEAALAPPPLPPEYIRGAGVVKIATPTPVATFQSPAEALAPQIKTSIVHAVDESTDMADAIMVLQMLNVL